MTDKNDFERIEPNYLIRDKNFIEAACNYFALKNNVSLDEAYQEAYVILVDFSSHDNAVGLFHTDPAPRHMEDPPNKRWTLLKVFENHKKSYEWLDSDEAMEIKKRVLTAKTITTFLYGDIDNPFIDQAE